MKLLWLIYVLVGVWSHFGLHVAEPYMDLYPSCGTNLGFVRLALEFGERGSRFSLNLPIIIISQCTTRYLLYGAAGWSLRLLFNLDLISSPSGMSTEVVTQGEYMSLSVTCLSLIWCTSHYCLLELRLIDSSFSL